MDRSQLEWPFHYFSLLHRFLRDFVRSIVGIKIGCHFFFLFFFFFFCFFLSSLLQWSIPIRDEDIPIIAPNEHRNNTQEIAQQNTKHTKKSSSEQIESESGWTFDQKQQQTAKQGKQYNSKNSSKTKNIIKEIKETDELFIDSLFASSPMLITKHQLEEKRQQM